MKKQILSAFHLLWALAALSGCYGIRSANGGGDISEIPARQPDAGDIALPDGYRIEVVATNLTFPSAITFDESGQPYVVESGYSYGEEWTEPRLLRISPDGMLQTVATGTKNGPWNGITFHQGNFYVSEGGVLEGGKIVRISPDGQVTPLVEGLPSYGDHHTNGPVVKDDYLYFAQGTATNSAVVGNDNYRYGWLKRKPDFHDIPCRDVVLRGKDYKTENLLTEEDKDKVKTGAFLPYGTPSKKNQVVAGQLPCSGAVLRMPLSGGPMELVAWGLRNPYGMAFAPDGRLFITENAYDVRGSRPVWGTGDVLWEIKPGTWYGWPDFSAGKPVNTSDFKVPGQGKPDQVLAEHPNPPPAPTAVLGVHSSSNGFDFARNAAFGSPDEAFVAQFGDMAPEVGKVLSPVGFKIVKVNTKTGIVTDFAVNKGNKNGPASWLKEGGLERPNAVQFDPAGTTLYVVDFGIMKVTEAGSQPVKGTGVVWKITRENGQVRNEK